MKIEEYNGYKVGALKRKFKNGPADFEPGTFIAKANEQKSSQVTSLPEKEILSIKGLV